MKVHNGIVCPSTRSVGTLILQTTQPTDRVEPFLPFGSMETVMRGLTPDPFAGSGLPKRLRPLTPVDKARMTGKPGPMVDLMAREMIEKRSLKGDCTETDLRMAGFKQDEIDTHKMAARQMAMRQVNEAA